MNFFDLIELSAIRAIHDALIGPADHVWRKKCREYSTKYHTPLHVVMELDPLFVLQHLYEDYYSTDVVYSEVEAFLEKLEKFKDPNYSKATQQETEDLVDAVINKEIARAKKAKSIREEVSLPDSPKKNNETKARPKSGGLDFSEINKLESMSLPNSKGTKD